MVKIPESPGPGEGTFSPQQAEGAINAPNGDVLLASYHSHLTPALALTDWSDGADPAQDPISAPHRGSSEQDELQRVRLEGVPSEPRLDRSARDLQRESALDSKQDDAGPLSDKS
jgi:hypothetical protein